MSANGQPTSPFQQWQNFYPPYAFMPDQESKVIDAVTNTERNLTAGQASVTKDIHQTTLGLRDAVEKGTYANGHAIERNANLLGNAIERNGGTIMTAIEKVAGEQRLTTTVTDAASRQAAADQARDLAVSIERNGGNAVGATQSTAGTLLSTIERNAGEGRLTTVTAQGFLDAKITDVRHSVLNDVNRAANDILTANTQGVNVLTKHVTDSAWETRNSLSAGFAGIMVAQEKSKYDIASAASEHYSSMMLEQQKMGQFLSSKQDNHFAMTQMEVMKCKSELASQSAQQFSISQLEQQKLGALVAAQMAEAKYDALKNTQDLGKQIMECCCSLKEKNDEIESNRLRDDLAAANNDNNMLKVLEQARQGSGPLGAGLLGAYGYPGVGPYGPGPWGPSYSEGYGNVHVYPDSFRGRGRRGGHGSRSSHGSRSGSPHR